MAPSKLGLAEQSRVPFKSKNKDKRHAQYVKIKKAKEALRRDERMRRKREEDKNPAARAQRLAKNVPLTIESKRTWDDADVEDSEGLGLSIDLQQHKRRKLDGSQTEESHAGDVQDEQGLTESKLRLIEQTQAADEESEGLDDHEGDSAEDDLASIMDESDEEEDTDGEEGLQDVSQKPGRPTSPAPSAASTNLSLIPDALASKFPTLFQTPSQPKILITTNLGGTVHKEAEILTDLFPNSRYIRRQRHRYGAHHFSLRAIAKFAANRDFSTLIVLEEDHKRPSGLTVIHLPAGPTFHFTMTNWIDGKKLPGHGNPTGHIPELIVNNFRTPLGLLTAHLFRTMFPPQPQLEGRQVLTLHNQRDFIFVRRHRYVFRKKKSTEKTIIGPDGKPVKGVEDIRAGLQELGPRFTLKLRRIDKGIQRASGQEWEWKGSMEKQRTKFQL